ncbi:MAG TPA: hypothetical protein PK765_00220 [bacterium]|nr:hypothetical protein [bacterium]
MNRWVAEKYVRAFQEYLADRANPESNTLDQHDVVAALTGFFHTESRILFM